MHDKITLKYTQRNTQNGMEVSLYDQGILKKLMYFYFLLDTSKSKNFSKLVPDFKSHTENKKLREHLVTNSVLMNDVSEPYLCGP